MRGQRLKQTDAEVVAAPEGEVIDVSAFKPRRIPSKKWRELIKKVWKADPHLEMMGLTLKPNLAPFSHGNSCFLPQPLA